MSANRVFPLATALAGLLAMACAMGIGRFVYTPILPAMMEGLGMSAAAAGWIASANYLGYLLGAVLAAYGWATGRERMIVLAGLAATAGLLLAMGAAGSVWILAFIRFAAGIASAFVMVFVSSIVLGHAARSGRPGVQSVHFAGVGTGIAASALLVGGLHAAGLDWRAGWFASGLLTLAMLAIVLSLLPRSPKGETGASLREPALVWTTPLRAVTLAYGIFGFGYIITATFLVAIVREGGGGAAFESLVWLVTGCAAAVSVAAAQPFAARFGLRAVFFVGCLIESAGVAASVLLPLPVGPLVGGFLLGATFVVVTAYGLQLGRAMAPKNQRRIFAFMTASFGLGQILGPVAAGYLAELTGDYTAASLAAAAALVVSALLAARSGAG